MNASDSMQRLSAAIDQAQSCACIGIDPVLQRLPADLRKSPSSGTSTDLDHLRTFCMGVIDAIAPHARVIKPQSACFERYAANGYAILAEVIQAAKAKDLVVILDAKRGDIGSSATHYAVGAAAMGADFITCSPYMGRSSIQPFLNENLGVFALCKTSNPDASELQSPETTEAVARMINDMGEQVGAVVGATNTPEETQALRTHMPDSMFLVPGVGAQGGTIEDVRAMTRPIATQHAHLGVVINASRSVLYPTPQPNETWQDAIAREAKSFAASCRTLLD
ncbi:MAG: orotidine-5'-phosphate decarboxylase [Phycisphaerales bacterium]|nr:orotidine-5'-phosphate decarboxylase [Phycisphaerales bacterium]